MNNFERFSAQIASKILNGGTNVLLALAMAWIGWALAGRVACLLQTALRRSARVDATLRPLLVNVYGQRWRWP